MGELCGHLEVAAESAGRESMALRLAEIEKEFRLVERALMSDMRG